MKILFTTSVSAAALLLAACGGDSQTEDDYSETQAKDRADYAAVDGDDIENDASDPAETRQAYRTESADDVSEDDFAEIQAPIDEPETARADAETGNAEAGNIDERVALNDDQIPAEPAPANLGSVQPLIISIADVRTEAHLDTLIEDAFEQADANNDDKLSRDEYRMLAATIGTASISETWNTEPDVTKPAVNAETDAELDADTETSVSDVEAADERQMIEDDPVFAEAAGDDETVEISEIRNLFMERFEIADANGDDTLDEAEQEQFKEIAMRSVADQ